MSQKEKPGGNPGNPLNNGTTNTADKAIVPKSDKYSQLDTVKSKTLAELTADFDQAFAACDDEALLVAFEALLDVAAGGDRRKIGSPIENRGQ